MNIHIPGGCPIYGVGILMFAFSLLSACSCPKTPAAFSPDRPGFATSPAVVPPCRAQIELGWTYTEDKDADQNRTKTHAFPETLLRIGLVSNLELRVDYGGYLWRKTQSGDGTTQRISGSNDAGVGLKYRFYRESGRLPESAIVASTSAPLGADRLSSNKHDPTFLFAFAHNDIRNLFSLNYNVGIEWRTEEDESSESHTNTMLLYAVNIGASISDRLGFFIEYYGSKPVNPSGVPSNAIDGGFTYLIAPDFQADISGGVGLSEAADDWFASAGFTWRFPD